MDSVFKANPSVNTLYVFDNGNAFISKRHAEDYKGMMGLDYKVVERNAKKEEVKESVKEEVKTESVVSEKEPQKNKRKSKNK